MAKGDFLFPRDEETDFLGHSKYARRDQRGKTRLQSHRRRNLNRFLLYQGWKTLKTSVLTLGGVIAFHSNSCPLTPARTLPWKHWKQPCLEGYTGVLSSKARWVYHPQQSACLAVGSGSSREPHKHSSVSQLTILITVVPFPR